MECVIPQPSVVIDECPPEGRCTPSPQPGDIAYQKEDDEMHQMTPVCPEGVTMVGGIPGVVPKNGQMGAPINPPVVYPQYYQPQYYQYAAPSGVPNQQQTPYGPTVVYTVPMQYYGQMRQGGQPAYPVEYQNYVQQQMPQQQSAPMHQHGKSLVDPPTIVKTPSRQRVVIWNFCQFCQNNREPEEFFKNHILRDADGKVVCPILRAYNCPICNNGGGDKAHTKSYCPNLRTSTRTQRRSNTPF